MPTMHPRPHDANLRRVLTMPQLDDELEARYNAITAAQATADLASLGLAAKADQAYVDALVQGLKPKGGVRAASTGNLVLSGLQTVDGVALAAGERVLAKDQAAPAGNGIYAVAVGAWTRIPEADTWTELVAAWVVVEEGATQADTTWLCVADAGGTLGVSAVSWVNLFANAVNTASNVGTAGVGFYDSKTGANLAFRKLNPASAKITITLDGLNQKVDVDVVDANLSIGWAQLTGVPATFSPTAHALDGAAHTIAGKTGGQVLIATSPTTFAFTTLTGAIAVDAAGNVTIANNSLSGLKFMQQAAKTYFGNTSPVINNPDFVTVATMKADLALVKGDVGLSNVDNTSNATERAAAATLTNKRITQRVTTIASSAAPAPNADTDDIYEVTALAVAATFAAPSGTPTNHQRLVIWIKDNGTARALTWNAAYVRAANALPTTTVAGKILILGFEYVTANALNKWRLIAIDQEA